MMTMLPGMLTIVGTWVLVYGLLAGVGMVVFRLSRVKRPTPDMVLNAFWIGFGCLIMFLQLWHLCFRVSLVPLILIGGSGAVGLALGIWYLIRRGESDAETPDSAESGHLHQAAPWVQSLSGSLCWRVVVTAVLLMGMTGVLLWLANRAMGPIQPIDAGLYHLDAIKWIKSYPIVPGLGNLHHRHGCISSYFLFMGAIDSLPWIYRCHTIGAGLLLMAALLQIVFSVWRVLCLRPLSAADGVRIMFLPAVTRLCFTSASSTTPDVPIFLLGVVVAVELAHLLLGGKRRMAMCQRRVFLIVFLSCVAVTVKLSFAVGGVMACLVALGFIIRQSQKRLQIVGAAVLLVSVVLMPFCARNVVTSGYPAYHSTLFGCDVAWRVPEKVAKHEADYVRSWARKPNTPPSVVLANWDWFVPWLTAALGYWYLELDAPLVLFMLGAAGLLVCALSRTGDRDAVLRGVLYLLPAFFGLIFWFWAAPTPRFAGALFWWLGAGACVAAFWPSESAVKQAWCGAVVCGIALVLTGGFHLRSEKLVSPGTDNGYYPIREAELKMYETIHGLKLWTPQAGDLTWDAPLPSTPYPNAGLKLRRSGDLQSGFIVSEQIDSNQPDAVDTTAP